MSGWTAKRFWKAAAAEACDGGFTVRLDARPVKTPAKAPLIVPSHVMAAAIAAEWDMQDGVIRPDTMPITRAANSAIDKVAPQFDAVVDELSGYGGTDLLCYRATHPQALSDRQALAWDPLLAWSGEHLGASLSVTAGVIPIAQSEQAVSALRAHVAAHDCFRLAALHDLVAISGSLILALAVTRQKLSPEAAFDLSRIDEAWQIEHWGEDEEAAAAESVRRAGFLNAGRFFGLCG